MKHYRNSQAPEARGKLKDRKHLALVYNDVRKTFFPRWNARRWKLRLDGRLQWYFGLCNRDKKIITLLEIPAEIEKLELLLVHEICHAVASIYHGRRWQRRMLKAAYRAERIGKSVLSAKLRADVAEHQKAMAWPEFRSM